MKRGKRSIIRHLMDTPATLWHLAAEYPGRLLNFVQDLAHLMDEDFVTRCGSEFAITPLGENLAQEEGLIPRVKVICPGCSGRGLKSQGFFSDVLREFSDIARHRPKPVSKYDQGYVEEPISVDRCLLLYERGDLEGRRVFLLGDDDLTSICMALTGLPKVIRVAEIDERITDFIADVAAKRNLDISIAQYDVREPLPEGFARDHDVFFTDPVETMPGIGLFLSRCVHSLKGVGSAGYFGLTRLEASKKKWAEIQRMVLDMNFMITDALPSFHRYILDDREQFTQRLLKRFCLEPGCSSVNWYNATLLRLEAIDEPEPLYTGECQLGEELYIDDDLRELVSD